MRARPMEFPRRLKELKELDNDTMFSLIGNDTNHLSDGREVREISQASQPKKPYSVTLTFAFADHDRLVGA